MQDVGFPCISSSPTECASRLENKIVVEGILLPGARSGFERDMP